MFVLIWFITIPIVYSTNYVYIPYGEETAQTAIAYNTLRPMVESWQGEYAIAQVIQRGENGNLRTAVGGDWSNPTTKIYLVAHHSEAGIDHWYTDNQQQTSVTNVATYLLAAGLDGSYRGTLEVYSCQSAENRAWNPCNGGPLDGVRSPMCPGGNPLRNTKANVMSIAKQLATALAIEELRVFGYLGNIQTTWALPQATGQATHIIDPKNADPPGLYATAARARDPRGVIYSQTVAAARRDIANEVLDTDSSAAAKRHYYGNYLWNGWNRRRRLPGKLLFAKTVAFIPYTLEEDAVRNELDDFVSNWKDAGKESIALIHSDPNDPKISGKVNKIYVLNEGVSKDGKKIKHAESKDEISATDLIQRLEEMGLTKKFKGEIIIYSTNSEYFASMVQAELTKKGYEGADCYGFASNVGVDLVYNDKDGRSKMGRYVYTFTSNEGKKGKKGKFEYTNINDYKFEKKTVSGENPSKGAHFGYDDDDLYYDNYGYEQDDEASIYAQEMNEYLMARLNAAEKKIAAQKDTIKKQRLQLYRKYNEYW